MCVSLTKRTSDHSSGASFSFSFYCDMCGKEWKSLKTKFESGGFTKIDNEEAQQLIWAHEHKNAFDKANLEAHLNFNYCSMCGRWVCDDCFNADSKNGICAECCKDAAKVHV